MADNDNTELQNTPDVVESTPSVLDAKPIPAGGTELPLQREAELLADTEFPDEEFDLPDQTSEDLGVDQTPSDDDEENNV